MIEGESNRLVNTNKWPKGMNQTSTELPDNFTKWPSLCGPKMIQLKQKFRFFANFASCLSPYG